MLQFPAFMTQYQLSTRMIPTSYLLPSQWPQPQSEELLLAMEESDFEEKVLSSSLSRFYSFKTISFCFQIQNKQLIISRLSC